MGRGQAHLKQFIVYCSFMHLFSYVILYQACTSAYYVQIPAGYRYSTILVASNNATGAMRKFGEVLRTLYSKTPEYRKVDYSINYLG